MNTMSRLDAYSDDCNGNNGGGDINGNGDNANDGGGDVDGDIRSGF